MKKIRRIVAIGIALVLMASLLTACVPSEATGTLVLSSSVNYLVEDGKSTAKLTATMVSSDEDIKTRTIEFVLVSGNAEITDDEIKTTAEAEVGEIIKVKATAGDITSNEIEFTVVVDSATVLMGLAIVAPANIACPGNVLTFGATKIPSTAIATVGLEVVEGDDFVESVNGYALTIKDDAPVDGIIKVRAKSGDITSDIYTVTILDPSSSVHIVANDNHTADFGDGNTQSMTVKVFNSTGSLNTADNISVAVEPGGEDILEAVVSEGRTIEFTVRGHGTANVVVSVDGTTTSKVIEVSCLKAPLGFDIPLYVTAAQNNYTIGLKEIEITETIDDMEFDVVRYVNARWTNSFTNLYSYEITEGSSLAFPVEVIYNDPEAQNDCPDFEFVYPDDSGITESPGFLHFSKAGRFNISVESTSGSKTKVRKNFYITVVDGIAVNTFEELSAIGMYYENVNDDGTVRPITLNPTESIGDLGYALVPEYLKNKAGIYNKDGSRAFTVQDFRGMVNCALRFFGNTKIIGNNVRLDYSRFPLMKGDEQIIVNESPYSLSGNTNGIMGIFETFMWFFPAGDIGDYPQGKVTPTAPVFAYKLKKDKIGTACNMDSLATDEYATRSTVIDNFSVSLSNFMVKGHWNAADRLPEPGDAVFKKTIEINRGSNGVIRYGDLNSTDHYVYPQCTATVDNVSINGVWTGMRAQRLADGSVISNTTYDNICANGLQITSSQVKLHNLTIGAVGGAGLEVVPEDSELAGDATAYNASLGTDKTKFVNQKVTISGDFTFLSGAANTLTSAQLMAFFGQIGYAPQTALNVALLRYSGEAVPPSNLGDSGTRQLLLVSLLGYQMGKLDNAKLLKETTITALYLNDLSLVLQGGNPIPNQSEITYLLDETGGQSNEIVSLFDMLNRVDVDQLMSAKEGTSTAQSEALDSLVASLDTTHKYISVKLDVYVAALTRWVDLGELIVCNPLYNKSSATIKAELASIIYG